MKIIGVVGTRRRDSREDFNIVKDKFFTIFRPSDKICSGLCPKGGDWFAVLIALGLDWIEYEYDRLRLYNQVVNDELYPFYYEIIPIWYPAEWKKYGKSAGFVRNIDIANTSDILIACVSEDRTGGTEDTIKKFVDLKSSDKNLYIM